MTIKVLSEQECRGHLAAGGVGRLAFTGRFGLTVMPVNFVWYEEAIVFRTVQGSPLDEDLRTGIAHADYQVAFEVDDIDAVAKRGWSVLVLGAAHHVEDPEEAAVLRGAGVECWPGGDRDLFLRIVPTRVTGRYVDAD